MDRITVLRAFVRLVELGSFSSVARELRVKQSTVSKWIASLEDELGVALLDRTTRTSHLTESGESFWKRASALIEDYDAAISEVQQGSADLRGRLRISLPVVFGRLFIVPELAGFLSQHPRLAMQLSLDDRYVNLVEEGFDLAVRVGTPMDSVLRTHPLGGSVRRLVAAPSYVHRYGAPRVPEDLREHQCLIHGEPGSSWNFTRHGRTHRVQVRGRISVNNSEATLALARKGLGIGLLASWLVDADLQSGCLISLLDEFERPSAPIAALTPPGRFLKPAVRALIEFLKDALTTGLVDAPGPSTEDPTTEDPTRAVRA